MLKFYNFDIVFQEIPDEVKDSLEIIPVKRIDEVLGIALKK